MGYGIILTYWPGRLEERRSFVSNYGKCRCAPRKSPASTAGQSIPARPRKCPTSRRAPGRRPVRLQSPPAAPTAWATACAKISALNRENAPVRSLLLPTSRPAARVRPTRPLSETFFRPPFSGFPVRSFRFAKPNEGRFPFSLSPLRPTRFLGVARKAGPGNNIPPLFSQPRICHYRPSRFVIITCDIHNWRDLHASACGPANFRPPLAERPAILLWDACSFVLVVPPSRRRGSSVSRSVSAGPGVRFLVTTCR